MSIPAFLLIYLFFSFHNGTAQEMYSKTPADQEGPFYPVTKQQDIDNDLTQVKGQAGIAKGKILNLSGKIVNTKGQPLKNLIIEIWQTDPEGRYKHPGDPAQGERDPNFQYWGAATTGADGTFSFKTILPGAYEPRPAHIHYKVWKNGKLILTSQIYFKKTIEDARRPSMTSWINLQTVDLNQTGTEEFKAFFRIII